jgi:hypothetical protein
MNVVFRISRDLFKSVQRDLVRPHRFASERGGFLVCRPGALAHGEIVILAQSFHSIADDDYVESNLVGAMMGSAAIRKALQIAYSDRMSMFHVHMHEHFGRPSFSSLDMRESAVFVLSKDSATGLCWYPEVRHPLPIGEIVVVGAPMEVISNVSA